jgi:DNA-binding NarL/FixJ family response regulator
MVTRLLVLTDHDLMAEALKASLGASNEIDVIGSETSSVEGAATALARAPDVVLVDYELSGGDCAAITRLILEMSPASRVVIVTAFEDYTMLADAMDAGCDGFVAKDSSVEDLVEAVRGAMSGEMTIAPDLLARLLPRLRRWRGALGSDLTPREREVLPLIVQGLSNADIARRLFISVNTVRNHVQTIMKKLGVHSRAEVLAVSLQNELVDLSRWSSKPQAMLPSSGSSREEPPEDVVTPNIRGDGDPSIAVVDLSQERFRHS